jgi:hypothetical protein
MPTYMNFTYITMNVRMYISNKQAYVCMYVYTASVTLQLSDCNAYIYEYMTMNLYVCM